MRRGLNLPKTLVQPNRQWIRQADGPTAAGAGDADGAEEETDEAAAALRREQQKQDELAKLDPAARAARLLQEKQRKLEEEKIAARLNESEENAGRDPALFSKRTAFDIRFDQIDEKVSRIC